MLFCPICSNLLLVEHGTEGLRFCCQTCPYVSNITQRVAKDMKLKRKELDDVLDTDDVMKNAQKTNVYCESCGNNEVRASWSHTCRCHRGLSSKTGRSALKLMTIPPASAQDGFL
jgi:DNA-directed RNA polymerase subunit M/transcription elongation factor TFIIS